MKTSPTRPCNGFHGWRILGLGTFSLFISVGFTTYILGLYIDPLAVTFNATPGQLGWAATIIVLMKAGIGPLLGHQVDAGRTRYVLTLGAAMVATGFLLLSRSTNLLQAGLLCTLLLAPGAGMLGNVPVMSMVVQWFNRRRGLATGIAAAGISAGGFTMPPVAAWLILTLGWRESMLVLGVTVAVFLLPAAWLIAVSRPADIGQNPDGATSPPPDIAAKDADQSLGFSSLIANRQFWLIALSAGTMSFCGILMVTFLVPFARETGIGLQESAWILSLYAISGIAGKFMSGWLCDRIQPGNVMTLILSVAAAGWLPLLYLKGPAAFVTTAVVAGFALGSVLTIWTSLIAAQFGPSAFGRVKGYMSLVLLCITTLPGPLAGYLHGSLGSYAGAFGILWWVVPLGIAGSLLLPRSEKIPRVVPRHIAD